MVPSRVTSPGTTLYREPPWMVPKLMVAVARGLIRRLTIWLTCCRKSAAAIMASTPSWGCPAWDVFPLIITLIRSEPAIKAPALTPTWPQRKVGHIWRPKTPWTPSKKPSCIMYRAPPVGDISSEGWNSTRTLPASSSFRRSRRRMVSSKVVICISWPQACMTPGFWEA